MLGLTRYNNYMDNYNPFREMENFERNAFRDFFGDNRLSEFKTDLSDEGDHYLLEADLPGFDKKDIDLELNGDVLTIRAERHSRLEQKEHQDKIVRVERSYGSYSRQFDMSGVDTEHIGAKYADGVLTLTLPKVKEEIPSARHLEIEG